ncbi:MAG: hypothetical protein B7Y39_09710 [Bdellovibrio sp. 28-41-41]|nr:MAG: hypothetical protein B7Y39_09710 [Bdellovibrio sp. 28-41-41]
MPPVRLNLFILLALTIFFTGVQPILAKPSTSQCLAFYADKATVTTTNQKLSVLDDIAIHSSATKTIISQLQRDLEIRPGIVRSALDLGIRQRVVVVNIASPVGTENIVLLNPKITPMTSDKSFSLEGCAWECNFVSRFTHIRTEYKDENGRSQILESHGDTAHMIQKKVELFEGTSTAATSLMKIFSKKVLKDYRRKPPIGPIQKLTTAIDESIEDSYNPYSLGFDVRKIVGDDVQFKKSIEGLLSAVLDHPNAKDRGKAMNNWVTSEAHALFLYDLLSRSGLHAFKTELTYLATQSVYFIESFKSGDSLVTYSFEKEGTTSDISMLFRPTEFSEKDWMNRSDEERIALLKAAKVPSKTFVRASKIMPTDFKPDAVGGYSKEVRDHRRHGYGWEISHKKYEINQQRLMREVRDVSMLFNQKHSFHVHVSFELPKNYTLYENFIHWFKQLNDYLYLKGLEEGLHGNDLTGVANFVSDLSITERVKSYLSNLYTKNTIQESQDKLDRRNSKFFSAGLRGRIYGPASSVAKMRLGIELRDSTRNMDLLDQYSSKVGKSVSAQVWEKSNAAEIKTMGLRLTSDRVTAKRDISDFVSPRFAKMFSDVEATVAFGLHHYEDRPIYNYRSHSWVKVSPEVAERIKNARKFYIQELVNLESELTHLESKGEKTETELIKMAIRMSLATWAKKARVAELFENF